MQIKHHVLPVLPKKLPIKLLLTKLENKLKEKHHVLDVLKRKQMKP
jgi:hypothetical protein